MYKIDMTPFNVTVKNLDGISRDVKYGLKESMVEILYTPALKLNSLGLLKQEVLAKKIANANDTELLLEDEEYTRLKNAMEAMEGFAKNDLTLVHRILEAQPVEVEVKSS